MYYTLQTAPPLSSHLPHLNLYRCEMEDTEPFIPTLDSLQFKLQHGDKSNSAILFEDAYCCEDSSKTSSSKVRGLFYSLTMQ